jgi:hypothetical protein
MAAAAAGRAHHVRFGLPVGCKPLRTIVQVIRIVMMVNCGACEAVRDVRQHLPANTRLVVVDSHRPIHHRSAQSRVDAGPARLDGRIQAMTLRPLRQPVCHGHTLCCDAAVSAYAKL